MRTNNGAIQLSRSIYDSDIWHKPSDWLKIWIYILGRVNYGDTHQFKRGQNFFKYELIAIECGTTYKVVENCIKFLKKEGQVGITRSARGVIIEVINYDKYQTLGNYEGNREESSRVSGSETSSNSIKEERKERKEIKNNKRLFEEFTNSHGDINLTSILIYRFLELGYNPSNTETIETFKKWFTGLHIPASECKSIINEFYEYWKFEIEEGRVKKSKNWKLTFSNNFRVKEYGK